MFVWTDLSTFDFAEARRFYAATLGWDYAALADDYVVGHAGQEPAAGLYPMPERFQQIGMPSFWMSYIRVADIEATVQAAEVHGGRIEVRPQEAPGGGRVALIRDPAGAGFTCYEGDQLATSQQLRHGLPVWHELHVSSLERVQAFYGHVFGWTLRATATPDRHEWVSEDGAVIAGVRVTPNEVKGDKEYWGVYFAVDDLDQATKRIERAGGQVVASERVGEQEARLAYDTQEAAFYVIERAGARTSTTGKRTATDRDVKWKAVLGLILVAVAVLFSLDWVWGVLFLLWALADVRLGATHFIEVVERRRNPVVFWLIVGTWVSLAAYVLLAGWD
ncbi:MAG: VOC family protein [Bacteroidota bacterium]